MSITSRAPAIWILIAGCLKQHLCIYLNTHRPHTVTSFQDGSRIVLPFTWRGSNAWLQAISKNIYILSYHPILFQVSFPGTIHSLTVPWFKFNSWKDYYHGPQFGPVYRLTSPGGFPTLLCWTIDTFFFWKTRQEHCHIIQVWKACEFAVFSYIDHTRFTQTHSESHLNKYRWLPGWPWPHGRLLSPEVHLLD